MRLLTLLPLPGLAGDNCDGKRTFIWSHTPPWKCSGGGMTLQFEELNPFSIHHFCVSEQASSVCCTSECLRGISAADSLSAAAHVTDHIILMKDKNPSMIYYFCF